MRFLPIRSTMRVPMGLLTIVLAAGCSPAPSDAPPNTESADCASDIARARQSGDSVFADARGLARNCPDAMATELVALWSAAVVPPERATKLRTVSVLVRDERLVGALNALVRDPARPIETRLEGLSTLSSYLQAGRWVEFTFLKEPPDSASLRMFVGVMPDPVDGEGSRPIPADFRCSFARCSKRCGTAILRRQSAARRVVSSSSWTTPNSNWSSSRNSRRRPRNRRAPER